MIIVFNKKKNIATKRFICKTMIEIADQFYKIKSFFNEKKR